MDGIFHTASPVDFSIDTYERTVIPAVRGTETILESAVKAGPQLSAVIITSSATACTNPKEDPEYTFTEKDFASWALETAEKDLKEGRKTPGMVLYSASKTAADRAVWKWRDEHKVSE
jgi:nucleoside-diphosphate-sugar epimerase